MAHPPEQTPIAEVVAAVFPHGSTLIANARDGAPGERCFVLGGTTGPYWLVPWEARTAHPFLRTWRPYSFRSYLLWRGAMAANHVGLMPHLPGVRSIAVAIPAHATWDQFGWNRPEAPMPVILVTGEGETSKAVVGLVDTSSLRVVCVAKVPLGVNSVGEIARETSMLESLNAARPGIAPRLLYRDRETGIAVQSMVEGTPCERVWTAQHDSWRAKLRDRSSTMLSLVDKVEEMTSRANRVPSDLASSLGPAMQRLASPLEVPEVWIHGDCAPWNLKRRSDGSLAAIDWEAADPHGLPGFDVVHFHTMLAFLFQQSRWPVNRVRTAVEAELAALDVEPDHAIIVISACVAEDAVRCMETGNFRRARYLAKQFHMLQNETMA